MIRRLYVHNFRCLENFELSIADQHSVLLIGKNGSGKTSASLALEVLQRIARGTSRIGDLVKPKDFTRGHMDVPMRFVIEVNLEHRVYEYSISFELPPNFRELRIFDERVSVDGAPIYTREKAQVHLIRQDKDVSFTLDWHSVYLPIIQEQSSRDPLSVFRQWLSRMLILRPIPSLINGESDEQTLLPNPDAGNFGGWFYGVMTQAFSAYSKVEEYLKQVMPDFKDIKNPGIGGDSHRLEVQFSTEQGNFTPLFKDISDGEKIFLICALVIAANDSYGPLVCFWDEPDNYLAPSEVADFVIALRKAYLNRGQFIATSHNPEAIRSFSDENTLVLHRRNHMEPTTVRPLSEVRYPGDLVGALIRGDVES